MRNVPLRSILIFAFCVTGLLPVLALAPTFYVSSQNLTSGLVTETLKTRSMIVTLTLARGLYAHWRDIEKAASILKPDQPVASIRATVEDIASSHEQYDWVGVAAPDGRVLAAKGGVLEGQDVSARPWFRAGLQGAFAGDVHEALLLQKILRPNSTEPLRFVDFSAPLIENGSTVGVIGAHLNWTWLTELIGQIRQAGVDILLVSREGKILLGPPELEGQAPNVPSLRAAQQGAARTFIETWPDGVSYISAVTPAVSYRNLPSFGWSVVARQPADTALEPLRLAARSALAAFAIGFAALVLIAVLVSGWISRPLRTIAESAAAAAAADGSLQPPVPEARRYREASSLSDAFQRLQSRISRTSLD